MIFSWSSSFNLDRSSVEFGVDCSLEISAICSIVLKAGISCRLAFIIKFWDSVLFDSRFLILVESSTCCSYSFCFSVSMSLTRSSRQWMTSSLSFSFDSSATSLCWSLVVSDFSISSSFDFETYRSYKLETVSTGTVSPAGFFRSLDSSFCRVWTFQWFLTFYLKKFYPIRRTKCSNFKLSSLII